MSGIHGNCTRRFFRLLITSFFLVQFTSAWAEVVLAPTFSHSSGKFNSPISVTIQCATQDASIFYTLDGSEPTTSSNQYFGAPIVVFQHVSGDSLTGISDNDPDPADDYKTLTNVSTILKTIAVKDGMENSPIAEAIYVIDRVDATLNVPYADPPSAGGTKHLLDIFQPHNRQNTPVLLFIHGGAWMQGDKNMYMELGNTFAGIYHCTTVIANYQLSSDPWNAVHPTHVEDVAMAFAWVYQNITEYGGDPENIYLLGQSAGGHLISLLATDDRYLAAHGLAPNLIRAVISMSGAYDLPDLVQWPQNPLDLSAEEVLMYKALCLNTFGGWENEKLNPASPSQYVNANQPPCAIVALNETDHFRDMSGFRKEAINFYEKIKALNGPQVELIYINQSDIPSEILELDFPGDYDAHYQEIYAINTEYWDSVPTQIVARHIQRVPDAPEPVAPLTSAPEQALNSTIVWKSEPRTSYYYLQVAFDFNFEDCVFDAAVGDTSWTLNALDSVKTYFWRAKAINPLGESEWSAVQEFRTQRTTVVPENAGVINSPSLIQVYPNPFNGSVQILLDLEHSFESENAGMEIFDILGRRVYFQKIKINNGQSQLRWSPAPEMQSGVYFITLQTPAEKLIKRITYLK